MAPGARARHDYDVYDIAAQVQNWLADGREVRVATVVGATGFSSRDPGASAAWTHGSDAVGRLFEGFDPSTLTGVGLQTVTITDEDAHASNLACGGTASVLVQPGSAYPDELWQRLLAREPVCLVTSLGDLKTQLFTATTIRDAFEPHSDRVPRLFGRGTTATEMYQDCVAVALWPVPALVVVGDGLIADALAAQAGLLGWSCRITPAVDAATAAIGELQHSDAVVVLSHDRDVDGPSLAAALAGRAGYVGALGSRHTQAERRAWLTAHEVPAEAQERIHGPAGLDIDAHTPAEIAVSIVAEILGSRGSSSGGALRDREGPVHVAGVQAPPPRY
jgi:xanthine dehydrogenase accessory factor